MLYSKGDKGGVSVFSGQLRKYRLAAGLSQKELAGKLFVSQQAIARWETNKATPNPETVVKLAEIFDVTTDELLGKESIPSSDESNAKENLQAAFWGGEKDLSQEDLDAMWNDVSRFAAFLADQKKQEKGKND